MGTSLPSLLLAFALISAAFTWNAWRPLWSPAVPSVASFFAGWLTSELALHHVAWQLVVAGLLVWTGAARGLVGTAALVLLALSWAGLWASHARARRSRDRVMRALADGLGPDYEDEILPSLRPAPGPPLSAGAMVYPFRVRRPDVKVERNLVFHQEGRLRLRLDVYRPRAPGAGRPMLVYVHGGAWVLGDKERQGLPMLYHLASRGWVCASISYRLSPRATFPDHIVDVKRAIAWVRAHAAELGGDPRFVAVAGGSAGGHLAALAAVTPGDPEYQPGFTGADTSVQAAIGIYGIYDFLDGDGLHRNDGLRRLLVKRVMKCSPEESRAAWERASPISRVGGAAPPFLMVHGTHDTLAPIAGARRFAAALRERCEGPVVLAEFDGAQHAFEIFPSVRTAITLEVIERFLAFVYSVHQRRHALPASAAE